MTIPVIDLFSGPGGMGEGFASLDDGRRFRILVSAEMDPVAHRTLRLRSYFRLLKATESGLDAYYDYCHEKSDNPWNSDQTYEIWEEAGKEALQAELGKKVGDKKLYDVLNSHPEIFGNCVLIGGPPCQAYSMVGRSRNKGKENYRPEADHRHYLYREYLRVIQHCRPTVFVMENVKGILSSKVKGRKIFQDILRDLVDPDAALKVKSKGQGMGYKIYSLVTSKPFTRGMDVEDIDPRDFVVRSESYGIPQARHRVILLGVREDIQVIPAYLKENTKKLFVHDAIKDLPRLRSGLSKEADLGPSWARIVKSHLHSLARDAAKKGKIPLSEALERSAGEIVDTLSIGGNRVPIETSGQSKRNAFLQSLYDPRLQVVLNHECRGHMSEDLRRYAFAATFGKVEGHSPKGHAEFDLRGLAPRHANWKTGKFSDRFRVQLDYSPATTVTSHISKDGHYFIHPDPTQCRSLTVREAARLQTFPDNYFFEGRRTQQFHQVGNAVPPMLASQIAAIVREIVETAV